MRELSDIPDNELEEELQRRDNIRRNRPIYLNAPIGWWKISIEDPISMGPRVSLGTHFGHIGDLALRFGNIHRVLYFEDTDRPKVTDRALVSVISILNSADGNRVSLSESEEFQRFLGPVFRVVSGDFYRTVVISREKNE